MPVKLLVRLHQCVLLCLCLSVSVSQHFIFPHTLSKNKKSSFRRRAAEWKANARRILVSVCKGARSTQFHGGGGNLHKNIS